VGCFNGIPLGGRDVFGIDSMDAVLNGKDEPVFHIESDGGVSFVQFAEQKRGEGEVEVCIQSTENLAEDPVRWSDPSPSALTGPSTVPSANLPR